MYMEILGLLSFKRVYSNPPESEFNQVRRLISFVLLCFSLQANAEHFNAASDIWSPFIMATEESYSGIGVDILNEVVKRTGDTVSIQLAPNKRAMKMFEVGEADFMILDSPLWNDPEMSDQMVFSDDVMSIQEYIYFLKSSFIEVKTPSDLNGQTVNILRGYYYPLFEEAFSNGSIVKNEVGSEPSLIETLVRGRVAAIFMDSIAFQYTTSKFKYETNQFQRGLQLSNTKLGIKIRADKAYVLPRFNQAIKAMKQDGTIDRIIQKYTE